MCLGARVCMTPGCLLLQGRTRKTFTICHILCGKALECDEAVVVHSEPSMFSAVIYKSLTPADKQQRILSWPSAFRRQDSHLRIT
jgi:hypothetical protein